MLWKQILLLLSKEVILFIILSYGVWIESQEYIISNSILRFITRMNKRISNKTFTLFCTVTTYNNI